MPQLIHRASPQKLQVPHPVGDVIGAIGQDMLRDDDPGAARLFGDLDQGVLLFNGKDGTMEYRFLSRREVTIEVDQREVGAHRRGKGWMSGLAEGPRGTARRAPAGELAMPITTCMVILRSTRDDSVFGESLSGVDGELRSLFTALAQGLTPHAQHLVTKRFKRHG